LDNLYKDAAAKRAKPPSPDSESESEGEFDNKNDDYGRQRDVDGDNGWGWNGRRVVDDGGDRESWHSRSDGTSRCVL
jgi:hypothetical protein